VQPSNKEAGYILRRLMRRIITYQYQYDIGSLPQKLFERIVNKYQTFPDYKNLDVECAKKVFEAEYERFIKTLSRGLAEFFKKYPEMKFREDARREKNYEFHTVRIVSSEDTFYFHQTYGLTIDIIKDLAKRGGHSVDEAGFNKKFKKHQEISRVGAEKKFGGHGIVSYKLQATSYKLIRLHTATHLLHQALRDVLGKNIKQMGSDINEERLRFDFSHGQKMTAEEIKKVEDLVNQKIKEGLSVSVEEMSVEKAKEQGAMGVFEHKYSSQVKVYSVGEFSKEICGGPHVKNTAELGHFKIKKEESSSAGVRRIKALLE